MTTRARRRLCMPTHLSALIMLAVVACDGSGPGAGGAVGGGSGSGPTSGGATAEADTAEDAAWFEAVDLGLAAMRAGRPEVPTILEVNGGGVALFDADGDGDLDLLLVIPGDYPGTGTGAGTAAGANRLYRNDGGRFTDVTGGSGVDVSGFCNGVAVGDHDGDGDRDVYITRLGPNALLRNDGGLRFTAVPEAGGAAGTSWSTSAVFVDLDVDGDLDLFVTNYLAFDPAQPPLHGVGGQPCLWKEHAVMCGPQGLAPQGDRYYRNDGGRFVDATQDAGFTAEPGFGLGVIDGDFDDDGRPDLYVSNDSTPNHLWSNAGDGRVRERAMLSGTALSAQGREQAGMGIAAGDLDADGAEDLMVTNFSEDANSVYRNEGGGFFRDVADAVGIGGPSKPLLGWGVAFADFDLDGDLDVFAANGHVYPQADAPGTDTSFAQPDVLWANDGTGRFRRRSWAGDAPAVSRAVALGDLDDDGALDLVVTRLTGPPQVWRGTADGARTLRVVVDGGPGNPDGLGTVLTWTDAKGERRARVRNSGGFQAVNDPRVVFAWRGPGRLSCRLPDGRVTEQDIASRGTLVIDGRAP